MKEEAGRLRERASRLEKEARVAREELEAHVSNCAHKYSPAVYDPIVHEAYTIPADPPGTMGVDWRPACHVPREVKDRWKRECELCGNVEYTTEVNEKITKEPKWRAR